MGQDTPRELIVIAGKGAYPLLLAESARKQGVQRLVALAFRGETDPAIRARVDEVHWVRLGQLQATLDTTRATGVRHAVMAGQITPTALFHLRPDGALFELLRGLKLRNAETIFGAVGERLRAIGVDLLPACRFMEHHMPAAGLIARRPPTEPEREDIRLGFRVAKATSALDIGQTVVVKEGTVLAVEAFEGTDETIRRAAGLAGPGIAIVKTAKAGHDMRFDIPVVGMRTMKVLRRARAAVLAVEASRTILLERESLVAAADRLGLCFVAVAVSDDGKTEALP